MFALTGWQGGSQSHSQDAWTWWWGLIGGLTVGYADLHPVFSNMPHSVFCPEPAHIMPIDSHRGVGIGTLLPAWDEKEISRSKILCSCSVRIPSWLFSSAPSFPQCLQWSQFLYFLSFSCRLCSTSFTLVGFFPSAHFQQNKENWNLLTIVHFVFIF